MPNTRCDQFKADQTIRAWWEVIKYNTGLCYVGRVFCLCWQKRIPCNGTWEATVKRRGVSWFVASSAPELHKGDVNIYDHPLDLSKLQKIRIKIVRAVSLMVSEGFGQLGRLFFSQCSHFKLGWPAKHLCHCFPDVRTRKERRTAGWAGTFSVL